MAESEQDRLSDLGPDDDRWDKPESGGPEANREGLRERCRDERETMTPQETADCAGTAIAEEFEGEEDGGS